MPLCSLLDQASAITGVNLSVDAGASLFHIYSRRSFLKKISN